MRVAGAIGVLFAAGCNCAAPLEPIIDGVSVDFGDVEVGSTARQGFALRNASVAAIGLESVSRPAGAFSIEGFEPRTLEPGDGVTLTAVFAPTMTGAQVVVAAVKTSTGREVAVTLRGNAIGVSCALPSVIDFGPVRVGDTARESVTFTASAEWPFALSDGVLTFKPGDTVAYTAVVLARARPSCAPQPVTLRGEGRFRVVRCEPETLDFGQVLLLTAAHGKLHVVNDSKSSVQLSGLTILPMSWFTLDRATAFVPANGSVDLDVSLLPQQVLGVREVTVMAEPELRCGLRAKAGGPEIEVSPAVLDLGQVPYFAGVAPSFVERSLTVSNTGMDPLFLTGWTVTALSPGADAADLCRGDCAAAEPLPAELRPGESVRIPVRVRATAPNASLVYDIALLSNDFDEPISHVQVTAQTVVLPACNYTLTPSRLDFGRLPQLGTRRLTFEIRNLGANAGETCLVTGIRLDPFSHPMFTLPAGDQPTRVLGPGEVLEVAVEATARALAGFVAGRGNVLVGISAPGAGGHVVVPLTGFEGARCLAVGAAELDFGDVTVGCASEERQVELYNRCPMPVTVSAVSLVPAGELSLSGAAPVQIPPGAAPTRVRVVYRPVNAGRDRGVLTFSTVQDALALEEVVRVTGNGVAVSDGVETFVATKPKVDVLVMFDDTSSMMSSLPVFSAELRSLPPKLVAANVDFHLGVVFGTCGLNLVAPMGLLVAAPGTPAVLSQATPMYEALFESRLTLHDHDSECLARPLLAAMSKPVTLVENEGFFRPGAALEVISVTDNDDYPAVDAARFASDIFAANPRTHLTVFGARDVPPMGATCGHSVAQALSHAALVSVMGGTFYELCSPSWAAPLDNLIAHAATGPVSYVLNGNPVGMPVVEVNGVTVLPGAVWSYDAAPHTVNFAAIYAPQPGSTVRVTYPLACH